MAKFFKNMFIALTTRRLYRKFLILCLAKGILLLHQSYFGSKLAFASFLINCLEHKNVHFPNGKFFRNFYIIFPFCVSLSPFLHIKVWLFKGLIL